MELASLRNSVVGLPGVNGLSVEQRKRLTIGVELVANPGDTSIFAVKRHSSSLSPAPIASWGFWGDVQAHLLLGQVTFTGLFALC